MSPRKGGIGRKAGRKRSSKQKKVSNTSLTAVKIASIKAENDLKEKLENRRKQQKISDIPVESYNVTTQDDSEQSKLKVELYEKQLASMPVVDDTLVGQRLDICECYDLEEGGTELRWSQGEVILVSNGSNILKPNARSACYKRGEAVMIKWDANKDRNEDISTSSQRLLPSKWNPRGKHVVGGWRLDIDNIEY